MGAFIVAGLIFAGTIGLSVLMMFAAGMSDSPSASKDVPVVSTFVTGTSIAAVVAATHWLPHIGW